MLTEPVKHQKEEQKMAAIDMGSNSFHMVIARTVSGEIRPIQKLAEKVRMASGLSSDDLLDDDTVQRGLDCLSRFSQCLEDVDLRNVRCVGTNTLRKARNGVTFLQKARDILNCPVEVVNGREEARLIYLGVSHSLPGDDQKRLVFDIGGGSTEFIIGQRFEPMLTESLHMGCVSYRDHFFPDGKVHEKGFKHAILRARTELASIEPAYRRLGWDSVVGASGTVKAIKNALIENDWYNDGIDLEGLYSLREKVLSYSEMEDIDIAGIKTDRKTVLPSGLAILIAIYEQLGVEKARFSDGAMREGILYDLLGRHDPEDVRGRTIRALMKRCDVDEIHAARVRDTALDLLDQIAAEWELGEYCREWLNWAALCHEVGMMVSHSGFHKHGAYLLTFSDLAGFMRTDQQVLAAIIGTHRRKIRDAQIVQVPEHLQLKVTRLILLLRLAVVMNRTRKERMDFQCTVQVVKNSLVLEFPEGWLEKQPLLLAELQQEQDAWKKVSVGLSFQ